MGKRYGVSTYEISQKSFPTMEFKGRFLESFGTPQLGGTWEIWGQSAGGKTSLAFQLAHYLTQFGKVGYNTYEEGISLSYKMQLERYKIQDLKDRFVTLPGIPVEDLMVYLKRQRSPNIIIMDSVQHGKITKDQYKKLKKTFANKLFIYISHARGELPKGEVADYIRFDADLKLHVKKFRCFPQGRFGGAHKVFDIYPEKSKILWGEVEQ